MQKPAESSAQVAPASQRNPNLLRDRLANERTFLAWLRRGITLCSVVAGAGLAIHLLQIWPT
jgi:uncharacterized membrane protein YidH (DUF202 family)